MSIIQLLNKWFNPNHSWMDYSSPEWGDKGFGKFSSDSSVSGVVASGGLSGLIESLINRLTGAHLTGAEQEANEFSAGEAQKSRDFTEYMTRNKYQMETQSMQEAGVNPAMMYGGGNLVSTASNGAAATSAQPSAASFFDILPTLARLPKELDLLKSEAERNRKEADAAVLNADSNARNAGTNEFNAKVNEFRAQVDAYAAASQMSVNDELKNEIAARAAYLEEQKEYISKNYALAEKNADSAQKQALASLKQADAAFQNALTNEHLSNYQASLMYAQELLAYANGEGQNTINKYLDPKQQQELENLRKQGIHLDKENRLIDKQGHLVDAETVKTYVTCGTEVANSVSRFVGISALTGSAKTPSPIWQPSSLNSMTGAASYNLR